MRTADAARLLASFTPDWLAGRRWFRAKRRSIRAIALDDVAPLDAADAQLLVLRVDYAAGVPDRYLVLARGAREPQDGEGAWAALVQRMAEGAELRGARGRFLATPTAALDELLPSPREAAAALGERRLGVEQSNTSVVLGERLILKLYRLVETGENPELEIAAFLADAGFEHAPALAGVLRYQPSAGDAAGAAMLQAYLPSAGDAWGHLLDLLAGRPADATVLAQRIGTLTAHLHRALASRPDDPAFPARPASAGELDSWRAAADAQLAAAVAVLDGAERDRLAALAPQIGERLTGIAGAAGARLSRTHGDFHLGQLLVRPGGELAVVDFEGEPARPLAERRRPSSPLRDVAGMLRSLDYAARSAALVDADAWLAEARDAFLGAYGSLGPGGADLLRAFELEKASYEVAYEANNRPDWLWLPLGALERLAA